MKYAVALLAAGVLAMPAAAQEIYADLGYQFISVDADFDGASQDIDLGAIAGHAGYRFNDFFAIEGEAAFGIQDEEFSATEEGVTVTGDLSLNYLIGVFVRGDYAVSPNFALFGRAGVVNAELEISASFGGVSGSQAESETGFAVGAGGEFFFTPRYGVRGEYARYDIEDFETDTFTVAITTKF